MQLKKQNTKNLNGIDIFSGHGRKSDVGFNLLPYIPNPCNFGDTRVVQ